MEHEHKIIRKCNAMLREAFGYSPSGLSKYAWKRATELTYLLQTGTEEKVAPPFPGKKHNGGRPCPYCGGIGRHQHQIALVVPTYRLVSWADRLGKVWVIAQWGLASLSEQEWFYAFGSAMPYPKQGRYNPITMTKMHPGDTPDENLTGFLVQTIREQMERTPIEVRNHIANESDRDEAASRGRWSDFVDDAAPTFGQAPGEKGHVSYPSVTLA